MKRTQQNRQRLAMKIVDLNGTASAVALVVNGELTEFTYDSQLRMLASKTWVSANTCTFHVHKKLILRILRHDLTRY